MKRERSGDSPRPKNDEKSKTRPTISSILAFATRVACDPEARFDDLAAERAELFQLRDTLYTGPSQPSRQKKKKRDSSRPSSPALFPGVPARSPARKGQRRQPNDFNTLLGIVANKYYAPRDVDLSRTIKSDKRPKMLELKTAKGVPLVGVQRHTTLGSIISPVFRPKPEDDWSPREIGLFESAMCNYGKNFNAIQRILPNKTTKEVIEFYYLWKKSENYRIWKESYKESFRTESD